MVMLTQINCHFGLCLKPELYAPSKVLAKSLIRYSSALTIIQNISLILQISAMQCSVSNVHYIIFMVVVSGCRLTSSRVDWIVDGGCSSSCHSPTMQFDATESEEMQCQCTDYPSIYLSICLAADIQRSGVSDPFGWAVDRDHERVVIAVWLAGWLGSLRASHFTRHHHWRGHYTSIHWPREIRERFIRRGINEICGDNKRHVISKKQRTAKQEL